MPEIESNEDCTGYEISDCCGAGIFYSDLCSKCLEHCTNQCNACEDMDCINRQEI